MCIKHLLLALAIISTLTIFSVDVSANSGDRTTFNACYFEQGNVRETRTLANCPDGFQEIPNAVSHLRGLDAYRNSISSRVRVCGISAIVPPKCPNDVSKIKGVTDYCLCEGHGVYRVSDGGICETSQKRECLSFDNCGDWALSGYNPINPTGGHTQAQLSFQINSESTQIISSDFAMRNQDASSAQNNVPDGLEMFSFWAYVSEPRDNLNFLGGVDDNVRIWIRKYSGLNEQDVWEVDQDSSQSPFYYVHQSWCTVENSWGDFEGGLEEGYTDTFNLETGWYFFDILYYDHGSKDFLKLEIRQGTDILSLGNLFETINSYGPLSLNLNMVDSNSQRQQLCENDPYIPGFWYDSGSWPDSVDINRRCCGSQPNQDYGFELPNGHLCTENGWVLGNECIDNFGNSVPDTHYVEGIGCCGWGGEADYNFLGTCKLQENVDLAAICQSYTGNNNWCVGNAPSYCQTDLSGLSNGCIVASLFSCNNFYSEDTCRSDICSWSDMVEGPQPTGYNLGKISVDNQFVCLKNADPSYHEDRSFAPLSYLANAAFAWRPANSFIYTVMQNSDFHYISDGNAWNYCAAGDFELENGISVDPGHVLNTSGFALDNFLCSDNLNYFLNVYFGTLDGTVVNCEGNVVECTDQYQDVIGFCPYSFGGDPLNIDSNFENDCGACRVKDDTGSFIGLNDFMSSLNTGSVDFLNAQCSLPIFNVLPLPDICVQDDQVFQFSCIARPDLCFLDLSSSCSALHMDAFGFYDSTNKQCGSDQLCVGGALLTLNDGSPCCFGENAICKDEMTVSCDDLNWNNKPLGDGFICNTQMFEGSDGLICCDSQWVYEPDHYDRQSFLCYEQEDKGFFRECCVNCMNSDNALSDYVDKFPFDLTASFSEPLQSILLRDFSTSIVQTIIVGENRRRVLQGASLNFFDWSSFDEVVFDIAYNRDLEDINLIVENRFDDDYLSFNILEYSSPHRGSYLPNRVIIPINSSDVWSGIGNIYISRNDISLPFQFVIDNIHLVDRDETYNTRKHYCAANFGRWVDFGDQVNPYSEDDLMLYRSVCQDQNYYGWTGERCCGVNTNSNEDTEEFWIDNEGICFGGVSVFNDELVSERRGLSVANKTLEESLLFFRGNAYSCNLDKSLFDVYHFSYDGKSFVEGFNFANDITRSAPYDVKGSWICLDEKWQKISDIGRSRLIAASLLDNVNFEQGDNYNLVCGRFDKIANFVPGDLIPFSESEYSLVRNSCVLRKKGENSDNDVFIGLEVADLDADLNIVLQNFLGGFAPFMGASFNCSSGDGFFSECIVDSDFDQSGFRVFFNQDFNIVLISDSFPSSFGVNRNTLQGLWNTILDFFKDLLFFWNDDYVNVNIPDSFTNNVQFFFKELYQNTEITSIILPTNDGPKIVVDYLNVSYNNVAFMADVSVNKFNLIDDDVSICHNSGSFIFNALYRGQSSFSADAIGAWKMLSTGLRLSDYYVGQDFIDIGECPVHCILDNGNLLFNGSNITVSSNVSYCNSSDNVVEYNTVLTCVNGHIESNLIESDPVICEVGCQDGACIYNEEPYNLMQIIGEASNLVLVEGNNKKIIWDSQMTVAPIRGPFTAQEYCSNINFCYDEGAGFGYWQQDCDNFDHTIGGWRVPSLKSSTASSSSLSTEQSDWAHLWRAAQNTFTSSNLQNLGFSHSTDLNFMSNYTFFDGFSNNVYLIHPSNDPINQIEGAQRDPLGNLLGSRVLCVRDY